MRDTDHTDRTHHLSPADRHPALRQRPTESDAAFAAFLLFGSLRDDDSTDRPFAITRRAMCRPPADVGSSTVATWMRRYNWNERLDTLPDPARNCLDAATAVARTRAGPAEHVRHAFRRAVDDRLGPTAARAIVDALQRAHAPDPLTPPNHPPDPLRQAAANPADPPPDPQPRDPDPPDVDHPDTPDPERDAAQVARAARKARTSTTTATPTTSPDGQETADARRAAQGGGSVDPPAGRDGRSEAENGVVAPGQSGSTGPTRRPPPGPGTTAAARGLAVGSNAAARDVAAAYLTDQDVARQVGLIDAALGYVARELAAGRVRVRLSDVPALIRARALITGLPTKWYDVGPSPGVGDVGESTRVRDARLTGDAAAFADAVRLDAAEALVVADALASSIAARSTNSGRVVDVGDDTDTDDDPDGWPDDDDRADG